MPNVSHADPARGGVLCLGRTYCDLVFTGLEGLPVLGREIFADAVAVVPGGGAFITAAHLTGLGRAAGLVTRLGTDALSAGLEAALGESGVDLSFVERAADAGPQLTVAIVQPQDRAFLSRRAGHGRPATLGGALARPGMGHLHVAEYATLVENPALLADAKRHGLSVSLDPSWDDALIRDPAFLQTCRGVDIFLPNADEALAIARAGSVEEASLALSSHFPIVVVKDGAKGAVVANGRNLLHMEAPTVPVVDTTGAGDAFNAGFLHAWLAGRSNREALAAAIQAGSLSVQAPGGATILRKDR